MMVSSATLADGRRVLILGLEAENMRRLEAGEPIRKMLDGSVDVHVPGMENWDLLIFGPIETADFTRRVLGGEIGVNVPDYPPEPDV